MEINGKKAGAAVLIGCAAACAGVSLVPVLLGGAAIGGGIAALEAAEGGMIAILLALGAVGTGIWYLVKRKPAPASCDCPSDGGCNTGSSCDLPTK